MKPRVGVKRADDPVIVNSTAVVDDKLSYITMMAEQVWDLNPPVPGPGFTAGEPTFSATPLSWTHAQFLRLAASIDAGAPVETPQVVACRYESEACTTG